MSARSVVRALQGVLALPKAAISHGDDAAGSANLAIVALRVRSEAHKR